MVSFTVVCDDIQVIIENIDGIDKRFDDVGAEKGIRAVAFCETMKEKNDAVTVKQLRLGLAEGFDGNAEGFGGVFKFFQHGGGGGVPDAGGDRVIYVRDLF